ncbi:glutamate receptor 2.9 isoform X2 [Lolium perenne]|uniref:glutamate receptor 2.9 isoform X2 n=1 Tax=Lolium perenne TaxID=4522 RepID=UPI0021F4FE6D|nr:glutamate receptor 2.9-like isoform X2 [Lolium perenne]
MGAAPLLQRHSGLLLLLLLLAAGASGAAAQVVVDVGVILDRTTWVGNISWTSIELALDEFYADPRHAGYRTRLKLHLRDTGPDPIDAAAAGLDLLKNVGVQAIVGPQTSSQAKFIAELGKKSTVPVISFSADCPSQFGQNPYFIRTAWNDSSQAEAIASLVEKHNWREVVPVFEDDDSNTRFIPDLVDALRQVDTRVSYRCKIHPSDTGDDMRRAISNLKLNWTTVFVVRMSHALALKFFNLAKDEGMMGQGYVWITAYGLTDIFDVVGSPALDVMQGVLGVKPHVQDTVEVQNFRQRWRNKYRSENRGTSLSEPTVSGLYAYDTIWAIALAAEKAGYVNADFQPSVRNNGSTDFDRIDTSEGAEKLRDALLKVNFSGMSGKFQIKDMQLVSVNYTIINIVDQKRRLVGFWTPRSGISGSLNTKVDLDTIIWPGYNKAAPRGWLFPVNKTLQIAVPVKAGFDEFVRFENGKAMGFCIDVFEAVVQSLPYDVPRNYVQFRDETGHSKGTYDDLVYSVYLEEYDAVAGDITILANRSLYVDFTLPYTESGVRMLVPVLDRRKKTAWTFLKPLTTDLWLGTGAFFFFTGFVVWCIEHRTNQDFRGPPASQIGSVLYFSFSTLVFAHREKIVNNLSRIVVVVWLFVVLIVQQSYTASLSSILTVEQLQPTVTNLEEIIRNGSYVGYLNDSFLPMLLKRLKIDESKVIPFDSPEEYNEALSSGRVAVIVDEIPYLKVFLKKYCRDYTMVGPTYKFDGFGYAFTRGSPLTSDISRGILKFASNGTMDELQKDLYGPTSCPDKDDSQTSSSLTLNSFKGLFIITGASSMLALILHIVITVYTHRHDFNSDSSHSSWRTWLAILLKIFHESDSPSNTPVKDEPAMANVGGTVESPASPPDSDTDTGSPPNHIITNLDSYTDTGSPPDVGTPGREVAVQDAKPLSFAYMHSGSGHSGVASLSRSGSSIRRRQISME